MDIYFIGVSSENSCECVSKFEVAAWTRIRLTVGKEDSGSRVIHIIST